MYDFEIFYLLFPLIVFSLLLLFPIYTLAKLHTLGREIQDLRRRLEAGPVNEEDQGPRRAPRRSKERRPAVERLISSAPPRPIVAPSAPPAPVVPVFEKPSEPTMPPVTVNYENLLGADWLAKLGIAAIALGAAFFLQYAFRSGWIGPSAQVAVGLVSAALLIGVSQFLMAKPKYRNYAQALFSGGIVVYFLSVYAAYAFYDPRLFGFQMALTTFAAGALAASALALRNNAQIVAILCILGAFAAPALIREVGGNGSVASLVRLYAYLAVLNLWVIAFIRLRPWHSLALVSSVGTWFLFFGAGQLHNAGWVTEGFAGLFLLSAIYLGLVTLRAHGEAPGELGAGIRDTQAAGLGLIVGGCIAFVAASSVILAGAGILGLPDLLLAGMLVTLILAGLSITMPALPRNDGQVRLIFGYLAAAGLGAVVLMAIGSAEKTPAEHAAVAFGFALLNFALFLAVALAMARRAEGEGPAAALVSANALVHIPMASTALWNVRLWGAPADALWLPVAGWIALLAAAWLARLSGADKLPVRAAAVSAIALSLAGFVIARFAGLVVEAPAVWLVLVEFAAASFTWLALGPRISTPPFRVDLAAPLANAVIFFGLLARAIGAERVGEFSPLAGIAVLMAVYYTFAGSFLMRRGESGSLNALIHLGLAITFITVAIPLQLRTRYITVAWSTEALALLWAGLAAREIRIRWYGLGLLAIAGYRALLLDLGPPAVHAVLFNSRMVAGGSVILAGYLCAWMLWRGRERLEGYELRAAAAAIVLANITTLLYVSTDLWDTIGKLSPEGGTVGAQQLALSLFWTLYALIGVAFGIWLRTRVVRLFAMCLLYVSILKVFLFDLRGLEQPYKIVSFIALGVILLVVSLLYTRFEDRLRAAPEPALETTGEPVDSARPEAA